MLQLSGCFMRAKGSIQEGGAAFLRLRHCAVTSLINSCNLVFASFFPRKM